MRMLLNVTWLLVMSTCTDVVAQNPPNPLQGIWRAVEVREEGRTIDPGGVQDLTLTVWQDRYVLALPDGTTTFNIALGADPAQNTFTLTGRSSLNQGQTVRGRYQLTGDELLVTYSSIGQPEPTSISESGEGLRTVRWQRVNLSRQPIAADTISNSIGSELRLVLPGTFVMGSPQHEPRRLDEVQHRVTISRPFYIGTYEVTVREFRQFASERQRVVASGGVTSRVDGINRYDPSGSWSDPGFSQSEQHPAVYISWEDANEFCLWLSQKEGRNYRLPTEAEWEYAARAGSQAAYWWGEDPEAAQGKANVGDTTYAKRFPNRDFHLRVDDGHVFTSPVGSFSPNAFGLYDMAGNVFEWVQDWYGLLGPAPDRDPHGPRAGQFRVARGGGWANKPDEFRSAFRFREDPTLRFSGLGFRIVLQVD